MVHRKLKRTAVVAAAIAIALLGGAFVAGSAQAVNTRVAISDFKWSIKEPQVDLGETVTWDWIGPDTQHSVSGQEPNATQWDSDPGNVPGHALGTTYSVTFDQPGAYLFVCKLHSSVRGTVIVSDQPGDPNSDPGPQASINFDMEAPYVDGIQFPRPVFGPKGNGSGFKFSVNERGTADADYYKLVRRGKKTIKKYVGYSTWDGVFIGMNTINFGARTETFKAKRGKYEAQLQLTDESANTTKPLTVQFQIKGKNKKKNGKKK